MSPHFNTGKRVVERCDTLGAPPYSASANGLERTFLSPAHRHAIEAIACWMREAGLVTRLDPMANLIGRTPAPDSAPCLMIGSHIDSVRNAGRYDGPLGVMIGIECAQALRDRSLPFAIEVVAFGDEEGSRFPVSMMGSRAVAGRLDTACLDLEDPSGITVREALAAFDLDPDRIATAARERSEVLAYIEPHIEQGPVLEAEGVPIGVVSGIAGQVRLAARFRGESGHAGASPMGLRRDALAAAAAAILAVETICAAGPRDLVGTVGRVVAEPGAFNVIPGAAEIGVDIRAASDRTRDEAEAAVTAAIRALAEARRVDVEIERLQSLPASPCDPALSELMRTAVRQAGIEPLTLMSGAGHDAMTMAALAPTAMLFVRCAGGISHHPDEAVTAEDAGLACRALTWFIEQFAETRA